jgi:hypothetical protein
LAIQKGGLEDIRFEMRTVVVELEMERLTVPVGPASRPTSWTLR